MRLNDAELMSRMAAVAQLLFLLFALINNIHGEESNEILQERGSHTFWLPKEANYCLISRSVGEEKLVLWNTSALRESDNSTVPEDLKTRLSVVNRADDSSYRIQNLTQSDSGLYQEQCWGNVTYENNISIIICTTKNEDKHIRVGPGGTVDVSCEGAADNQDVHWFRFDGFWIRISGDRETSAMVNDEGRGLVVKTSLRLHNLKLFFDKYICVVMNHQQCVSSQAVFVIQDLETIHRQVGETAVLQCPVNDSTDGQTPVWKKYGTEETWTTSSNTDPQQLNKSAVSRVTVQNSSLVISSLTLNDSGFYTCKTINHELAFTLLVCPESGPPAVELFSEGDNITFSCRGWRQNMMGDWFIRSNQTDGRLMRLLDVASDLRSRVDRSGPNGSLILYNVSLEDAGDYWCAVTKRGYIRCASTTKILLKLREPPGFQLSVYILRCWLLTGLLVILCVTVVTVTKKVERGEQRSAETDT